MKKTRTPALLGLLVLMQLSGCAVVSLSEHPVVVSKSESGKDAAKPPMTTPVFPAKPQQTVPTESVTLRPPEEKPSAATTKPPVHQAPTDVSPPVEPAPVLPAPQQAAPHSPTQDVTQAATQAQTHSEPKPETPAVTQAETQAVTHPITQAAPRTKKDTDTEIALAKPEATEAKATHHSQATNPTSYRRDAARHLYQHYAHRIYKGKLPPMLKGVGVVEVVIGPKGQIIDIRWVRAPKQAPELSIEIENLIRIAGPFPAPVNLRKVTYTETWLWHVSGKFQLDTLTEGQN